MSPGAGSEAAAFSASTAETEHVTETLAVVTVTDCSAPFGVFADLLCIQAILQ